MANCSVELLSSHHETKAFLCGFEPLERYLRHQAGQDARRRVAVTYVLTEGNSKIVLGYYSLSSSSIELNDLPEVMIKKLPKYPTLPATLLGRLAVAKEYQGKGFGELLLLDALKRSLKLSSEIASMALVVEAKNEGAVQFYRRYEFMQFPERQFKLFLPMRTIAQTWNSTEQTKSRRSLAHSA